MPVPREKGTADRRLLRDTAYEALCDAIVDGTLEPGEQLHDAELCDWLGLSRTPVRGALARLEDEKLVETAAQRFTRVAPIERQGIREVFSVLAVVHALATESAAPRFEEDDLRQLKRENDAFVQALRAEDAPGAYAADERFHGVFVDRAGNDEIRLVLRHLGPRLHRFERLCDSHLPGRRSVAQHQAIMSRVAAGEVAQAASAVRANWVTLGGVIEHALDTAASGN